MNVHLLGINQLDFTPPDGKPIKGTQLFISFPDDGVLGERAEKLFIRDGFELPTLNPGELLDVDFNNKGKPVSIKVIHGSTPGPVPGK